jgi:hypothetical protein
VTISPTFLRAILFVLRIKFQRAIKKTVKLR